MPSHMYLSLYLIIYITKILCQLKFTIFTQHIVFMFLDITQHNVFNIMHKYYFIEHIKNFLVRATARGHILTLGQGGHPTPIIIRPKMKET